MSARHDPSGVLFVLESPQSMIAECILGRGHDVRDVLVSRRRLGRVRQKHLASRLPGQGIWFNDDGLSGVSTVVIFDRPEMFAITRWLRQKHPGVRVILWCWNLMPAHRVPADAADFEVVTFDPGDAERYGFRLESTFYFRELQQYASTAKDHDLVFIGRNKGRRALLDASVSQVRRAGGSAHVDIVAPGDYVPYRDVLELTGRSRAVLDVVREGQRGLTLRSMEALFLGVRLLTNSPTPLTDEHYPAEHVRTLSGDDEPAEVLSFLSASTAPPPESALAFYDFGAWLGRLLSR